LKKGDAEQMDLKGFAEKIGLDEDEFAELLELFIETCISDLEKLKAGVAENDARKVSEAAHSIKGSSGNMGFEEIYELAKHIEMNARKKILDNAMESAELINTEIQKISRAMNQ